MKNLSLKTQGIRGGDPSFKEKIGYINAGFGRNSVLIDNFVGYGKDYKQRGEPKIDITKDGKLEFSGTISELVEKLKDK